MNRRRIHLKRTYGTTIEELETLLLGQRDRCAICARPWLECKPSKKSRYEKIFLQYLHVDHDHKTGRVRGLLCNACNTAIGLFEEDIAVLASAAAYLRKHRRLISGVSMLPVA